MLPLTLSRICPAPPPLSGRAKPCDNFGEGPRVEKRMSNINETLLEPLLEKRKVFDAKMWFGKKASKR